MLQKHFPIFLTDKSINKFNSLEHPKIYSAFNYFVSFFMHILIQFFSIATYIFSGVHSDHQRSYHSNYMWDKSDGLD